MEDAICVLWPDTLIVPYGSYASGMMTPDSDVDMVVSVSTGCPRLYQIHCIACLCHESHPCSPAFSFEGKISSILAPYLIGEAKRSSSFHIHESSTFYFEFASHCKAGGLLHLLVCILCGNLFHLHTWQVSLCVSWRTIVPRCLLWAVRCSLETSESARHQARKWK